MRIRTFLKRLPGARSFHGLLIRSITSFKSIGFQVSNLTQQIDSLNQQIQINLVAGYRNEFQRLSPPPFDLLKDAGFRCFSQFEEDGIILYILAAIGMKTRRVVEIGSGNGRENMSSNLIINHGFEGFLFDGSRSNIENARRFYNGKKSCFMAQPQLQHAWISRENVNDCLSALGAVGEVDVFSLDIDGNDWHIWKQLDVIAPRLCVFEVHNIIPDNLALTMPYRPNYEYQGQDFRSCSLAAMVNLNREKGYRLIGGNRNGINAFFLRNDIAVEIFPEVSVEQVNENPVTRNGQRDRWMAVSGQGWLTV